MAGGVAEEEVLSVIRRHPEVIVEALASRPELLLGLVLRHLPLDKLATKDDIKLLIQLIDKRFEDMNNRFEDMNRRFEEVNRRIDLLEKLIFALNIPILITVITIALKLLTGG